MKLKKQKQEASKQKNEIATEERKKERKKIQANKTNRKKQMKENK